MNLPVLLANAWYRLALARIHYPTFKHFLLTLLASWALWIQVAYPIPTTLFFLLLPWIGAAVTGLAWVLFLNRLLDWLAVEHAVRDRLLWLEGWGDRAILLFVSYGMFLFMNGTLAPPSSPLEKKSQIVAIAEVADAPLEAVVYSWIDLRSWDDPSEVIRVLRRPWAYRHLWPGQLVLVQLRQGAYGLWWVDGIRPDREEYLRKVLEVVPRAAGPWKELTNFYLERRRWEEASWACQQYLDAYPSDSEFAIGVAGVLGQARQDPLSIPILEKVVDHKPDYVSLISLGWALSDTGQRERGVKLIESAIPFDPESWWAYYHLGYVYRDMGRRDKALAAFREVLRRRPDYPEIERQISLLQRNP